MKITLRLIIIKNSFTTQINEWSETIDCKKERKNKPKPEDPK